MECNLKGPIVEGPLGDQAHACMPWRIFKSLSWLVNMKSRDDLCITGLCPSVRAAVLPLPLLPVSKAQRGG